jgi:predicted dehydrogenase
MLTIAQIGCGYWGPNLLRNFSALPDCHVKYVSELSEERREFVTRNYPRTSPVTNVEVVLEDPQVDAVVIATPAGTHCRLAKQALHAGKHVFVEKPLATTVSDVDDIAAAALTAHRIVMAGHTFLYSAPVEYLRKLVVSGELGEIYYIYAQRLNLGVVRHDVDVLWNLAPHDISIIEYLLGGLPLTVSATGCDYLQRDIADVVFLNLAFPGKLRASVHVSWLDPQKVRRITIVGSQKMVVYDDIADDKIAIFDKGIDCYRESRPFDEPFPRLVYRTGDVVLPRINFVEPVRVQAMHFLDCVASGREPKTNVRNARDVVAVLAAASESLRSRSIHVDVSSEAIPRASASV